MKSYNQIRKLIKYIFTFCVIYNLSLLPSVLFSQIDFSNELNRQFKADSSDIYNFLTKKGYSDAAIITAADSNGLSLIHYTVYYDNRIFLKKLIELGVDINLKDKEGRTPLMLSVFITNTELAQELANSGADVNVKDNRNNTPYALARLRGYTNLCSFLKSKGADGKFEFNFSPKLTLEDNSNLNTEKAVISPDNKILAALGNNALCIWSIETKKLIYKYGFYSGAVKEVDFSEDSKFLVLSGDDFTTVFDIKTFQVIRTIEFNPDSSRFVSKDIFDSTYILRILPFGKVYSQRFYNGKSNTITEIIKPFRDSILYFREYSIKTGKIIRETTYSFDINADLDISFFDYDEDLNLAVLGYSDGTIKKYQFGETRDEKTFQTAYKYIRYLKISSDHNFIFVIDINSNLKKIRLDTGEEIYSVNELFSPEGRDFIITNNEIIKGNYNIGYLNRYSVSNGKLAGTSKILFRYPAFNFFSSDDFSLLGIIESIIGKCEIYDKDYSNIIFATTNIKNDVRETKLTDLGYLYFICNDKVGSINVNLPGETFSEQLENEYNYFWSVNTNYYINIKRYTEDDKYGDSIIIKNFNDRYYSYKIKLEHGDKRFILTSNISYLFNISSDGKMLAIHYKDIVLPVNLEKKEILGKIETGTQYIISLSFTEDSKHLLLATFSNLKYFELKSLSEVYSLKIAENVYTEVVVSPKGKYIVTSNSKDGVLLWDIKGKSKICKIFDGNHSIKNSIYFNNAESGFLFYDFTDIKNFNIQRRQWDEINYNYEYSDISSPGNSYIVNPAVNYISVDESDKYLFISRNSFMKVLNYETGRELCTIYAIDSTGWTAITPDGYYDGTQRGLEKMHWSAGGEIISLTQIPKYYYPGLLKAILTENKEIQNKENSIPDLKLPPQINTIFEQRENILNINAVNNGGGIGKMMLYIDGKEIDSNIAFGKYSPYADTVNLKIDLKQYNFLVPGRKHDIEVRAVNSDFENIINSRQGFIDGIQAEGDSVSNTYEPRIFILSVGINDYSDASLRLNYCVNDAKDFLKAVKLSAAGLLRHFGIDTNKVIPILLTGGSNQETEPTKENISRNLQYIKENAKYDDIIIYYFAGHGINRNSQFYYLTKEAVRQNLNTKENLESSSVSGSEILNSLKNPAKKQIIILDVCGSGAIGSNDGRTIREQIMAFQEMKNRGGQFILAGCQEDKESYEAENLEHGILTYSLLTCLRNGDGLKFLDESDNCKCYVDIYSLLISTAQKTIYYAKQNDKNQIPVIKIPGSSTGFIIGRLDDKSMDLLPELKSQQQSVYIESIRKDNARDKEYYDYIKNRLLLHRNKDKNNSLFQLSDKNNNDAVKIFINYENSKEQFVIVFSKTNESCDDKIITLSLKYSEKDKLSDVLIKELEEFINNCSKKIK